MSKIISGVEGTVMADRRRRRQTYLVVSVATVVAIGALGLSAPATGAAEAGKQLQPRAGAYQYGNWSTVGSGVDDSQVYTLLKSDAVGILATGTFTMSGGIAANRVVQLTTGSAGALTIDDSGFDPGLPGQYTDPVKPGVYASTIAPDDSIYAGGYFATAGDDSALNVARWNGVAWVPMGFGLRSPTGSSSNVVENIVVGVDDTNYADDTVYAIGEFTDICTSANCATSTGVSGFAQWSDDTWYPMGSGSTNGKVFAGAYADDTLYVGGQFTQIQGQNITRLAAWRASDDTWVSVGNWSPTQQVAALTVHPTTGDVYAAGYFSDDAGVGGAKLSGVARYRVSDDTWYPVGDFTTNVDIATLAFDPTGTHLYIGGRFTSVGGTPFSRVAKLSGGDFTSAGAVGGTWQYLKSAGVAGVNGSVRSIVVNTDGSAYVGGDFTTAGPISAGRVALFTPGAEPSPYDPVYPPGAPTDVVATTGWRKVTVDWTAPKYAGSFPITNYLVTSSPDKKVCITSLADANLTQCTFTNLTPGVPYTFDVQALNGGGWGGRSAESNAATAQNLRITSYSRKKIKFLFIDRGSEVKTTSIAPGFDAGTRVVPWIKIGDADWVERSGSSLKVNDAGGFTWTRKFAKSNNRESVSVKFAIDGNFSNTVVMGPVR